MASPSRLESSRQLTALRPRLSLSSANAARFSRPTSQFIIYLFIIEGGGEG